MSQVDLLYQREALKIEILADRPKILAFIKNSYQLWMAAQWEKKSVHDAFYGTGWMHDVLGRQLARKSCMSHWRLAKETDNIVLLIEPVSTVLNYTRDIACKIQDYLEADTPYDALVQFQTAGFVNPLHMDDLNFIHQFVSNKQVEEGIKVPKISKATHDHIVNAMIDLANIDHGKVEIIGENYSGEEVSHPACMGYGGHEKGVKLGVTYNPNMSPLKSLLTNWHEIGHAAYRQSIPYGQFIAGRAMDEAIAFLFEYWIGYSDEFFQFLLDEGLAENGYTLELLRAQSIEIIRNTNRIETNPIRHIIDIHLCDQLERALINGEIEGEDAAIEWAKFIEPYSDILPDHYPYYADVHMMSGIYGDRACYTPGLLAAMQIGSTQFVTINNFQKIVKEIVTFSINRFDQGVERITGKPLTPKPFMQWMSGKF